MNLIKILKYMKSNKNLVYTLFHMHFPKQVRPYNIDYTQIESIFKNIPRKYWYNTIVPLLWDIQPKRNGVIIANEEFDTYPYSDNTDTLWFNIEDLNKDIFDIEPGEIYTHKKYGGIFVADSYIPLDKRYEGSPYDRAMFGSIVFGYGVAKDKRTYGFECGHHCLNGDESFYNDYTKINYTPIEGSFLYYIQKMIKKEITPNWNEDEYVNSIFAYADFKYIDINSTKEKQLYESYFKEYNILP